MTQHNPECGLDCVSAGAVRIRPPADADQSAERQQPTGDHTPEQAFPFSPWIVGFGGHSGGYWTWAVETQAEPMAIRVENAPNRATAIAAAKFVAAAPEMLGALKYIDDQLSYAAGDGKKPTIALLNAILVRCREAIAKAEGRQS